MELEQINNEDTKEKLMTGIILRSQAAVLRKKADEAKAEADAILKPLMSTLPEPKVVFAGVGSITYYPTTRSKFDKDGAKLKLVQAGLDALRVERIYASSTTTTESYSMRFTEEEE